MRSAGHPRRASYPALRPPRLSCAHAEDDPQGCAARGCGRRERGRDVAGHVSSNGGPPPGSATERSINLLRKRRYDAVHRGGAAERTQHPKGKLTARERIERFLDPGSFTETDVFAVHRNSNFGMEERRVRGDGVVTGWGTVDGRQVFVFSHDASVFGGSLGEVFAEKVTKIMDLAVRTGSPCVGINDSGGARIQEGVVSLAGYAEIFYRNVEASGVIPQLSLIVGPCTGGAVYSPAMTDFIFMVRKVGYMFITGPDVIKVTTGERVTFEDLGGSDVHNQRSGVAHFNADTEDEAFTQMRALLGYLPANNHEPPPYRPTLDDPLARRPRAAVDHPRQPQPALRHARGGDARRRRRRIPRGDALPRAEHHLRVRQARRPLRRRGRQPAARARRRARHRGLHQGGAVRALLRRLQHPAGDLRRRPRLPSRHRPGVRRASSGTAPSCSTPTARPPCPS